MKAIVCGGRDFSDRNLLFQEMDKLVNTFSITEIAHGAARGADSLADQWATEMTFKVTRFPADWAQYGKSAGMVRNRQMYNEFRPDIVIAFKGGRGTEDMMKIAAADGCKVFKVEW